jgi:hypothetical protein
LHEPEVFIYRFIRGLAIADGFALQCLAYESLRLALWVKIDEKK